MSLRPDAIGPIPDEPVRVARAAFPKGTLYMQIRDVLGAIYDDARFSTLYPPRGRPAETPWRLALVTVLQFAAGLSDRQAAEAVRARIDWTYCLGLELTDAGFDYAVLSLFRTRLVEGGAEAVLLDALLEACTARGYLLLRGQQRTDATHVLGVLRVLNRLECVAETQRATLNAVAEAAPPWLQRWTPAQWFERYSRRIEDYGVPKGKDAPQAYAEVVGADGLRLLTEGYAPTAPPALRALPAVEILRRTWIYHYQVVADQVRLRAVKDLPPVATRMQSPYEPEARYGEKRGRGWTGYKVHVSESCADDAPHLLTHVDTTVAPATDVKHLAVIHAGLAGKGLIVGAHQGSRAQVTRIWVMGYQPVAAAEMCACRR